MMEFEQTPSQFIVYLIVMFYGVFLFNDLNLPQLMAAGSDSGNGVSYRVYHNQVI